MTCKYVQYMQVFFIYSGLLIGISVFFKKFRDKSKIVKLR